MDTTLFNIEPQAKHSSNPNLGLEDGIRLSCKVEKDKYTEYITQAFDYQVGETVEVIIPKNLDLDGLGNWQIGVICGASGSGKSTVLKSLGSICEPSFDCHKSLISNFDNLAPNEACALLSAMGLASVPSWVRPFNALSNGEKYRATLAKVLSTIKKNDICLVDEYTSVVDRNVAKAMSNSLQKYIRRTDKRIILATCHYDILEWLRPDWVYDLNKGGVLDKNDNLRQRPQISLQVFRTTPDTWNMFKKHHYMTEELNKASMCFVFVWNDRIVGFNSILPFPNGALKNAYREHRLVVLPDYQGLGIGTTISNFTGGILANSGKSYYTKTVNPALGEYRETNKNWCATTRNKTGIRESELAWNMMGGKTRVSYCHKYVGDKIGGYDELLNTVDELRFNLSIKYQLSLF